MACIFFTPFFTAIFLGLSTYAPVSKIPSVKKNGKEMSRFLIPKLGLTLQLITEDEVGSKSLAWHERG